MPQILTRRLIKQKARSHLTAPTLCGHRVSGSISLRSQRFFSPFPYGTCSLSVANEYLALEGGPPVFTHRSTCGVLLAPSCIGFRTRGCHALCLLFPKDYSIVYSQLVVGLLPVRSPLLRESRLISFPPVTEMFHFTGYREFYRISRLLSTSDRNIKYYNLIGYPIRKSPGQRVCAPHRRLSQLITSFIAC